MNKLVGYRFPEDFMIGTANSAFQSEGAADRDGKSESNMDYYARQVAGKPRGKSFYTEDLPDRGCFFYDNYEGYIEDMQKTGQNTYRLSISWPRIIPDGVGAVNPKGIDFYNKVFDKMLSCGITPFVDLYHWDMPQCLQEKGGFLNPEFGDWFEAYAKVCFETFGDRVKMWSTFNESVVAVIYGYGRGTFPPFGKEVKDGIQASHNCLLAHFRAVKLYKSMNLGGKIGAVNVIGTGKPVILLGKVNITGNTKGDTEANNLHVQNGATDGFDVSGLAADSSLVISLQGSRITAGKLHFTTADASNDKTYFTSDAVGYLVDMNADNKLYLKEHVAPEHSHCVCGKTDCDDPTHTQTEYQKLTSADQLAAGGAFYLAEDIKLEKAVGVKGGMELTICLNGHKLTSDFAGGPLFWTYNQATINLCDCQGNTGAIENITNTSTTASTFFLRDQAVMNIYGGQILNCSDTKGGGAIRLVVVAPRYPAHR